MYERCRFQVIFSMNTCIYMLIFKVVTIRVPVSIEIFVSKTTVILLFSLGFFDIPKGLQTLHRDKKQREEMVTVKFEQILICNLFPKIDNTNSFISSSFYTKLFTSTVHGEMFPILL